MTAGLTLGRIVFCLLVFISCSAFTHGLATPVIDSSFTCFRSAASGTCGAATAHNFDAVCDGIADDSPSLTAWTTYGIALNPALVKLYIPPGSTCRFAGDVHITWDGIAGGSAINNVLIVAYGASINFAFIGGETFYQDASGTPPSNALIATVGSGATTLSVIDGNVGRFSVGDKIWITGDCLDSQTGGFPPTFQFYDRTSITNISGTTISIASPTTYQYKSTWPLCTTPSGVAGPATIFKIPPDWDTEIDIYGLTITNSAATQINIPLRAAYFQSVTVLQGTIAPSGVDTFFATNSTFSDGAEIDKENGLITIVTSTIGQIANQQPSPKSLVLINDTVNCVINGTPLNITTSNVTIVAGGGACRFAIGSNVAGHVNSVSVTGGSFPVAAMETPEFLISDITSYSNGTFVLAKTASSSAKANFFAEFVPGFEYKFSYHNALQNGCTPLTTFWGVDLREDASNYYFDTGTWVQAGSSIATPAVLPSLSCLTTPTTITPYPAQTITQTGTGASPSLTIFAPPQ